MASTRRYNGDFEFDESDEQLFLKNTIQRLKKQKLSTSQLLTALKNIGSILKATSPNEEQIKSTAKPLCLELVSEKFTRHSNKDVRLMTGYIFGQFLTMFSPHSPLSDDQIPPVFAVVLELFEFLKSTQEDFHFVCALETLQRMAESNFCLLLLDLDSNDLLFSLLQTILRNTNEENYCHTEAPITEVLVCILDAFGEVPEEMVKTLLHFILEEDKYPTAARLVGKVIDGVKMSSQIHSFCVGLLSKWLPSDQGKPEYCQKIIIKVSKYCPMVAGSVLLHIRELLQDVEERKRLKMVEMVMKLLGSEIQSMRPEEHKLLLHDYTERLEDIKVEIRSCTVSSIPEILPHLSNEDQQKELFAGCLERLLDPEDRVRSRAITSSVHGLLHNHHFLTEQTLLSIFLRLKDKKSSVRKCAIENCLKLCLAIDASWGRLKWTMTELMGHFFETITAFPELRSLFYSNTAKTGFLPNTCSPEDNAQLLMRMYSKFTPNQQKCFLKTISVKYSLQGLVSEFVAQMLEDGEKKDQILNQIVQLLPDAEKAKFHFQKLMEVKDKRLWKLMNLTCSVGVPHQSALETQKEFLNCLGAKHGSLEFLKLLLSHTSPSLFPKQVLSILLTNEEAESQKFLKALAKSCGVIFLEIFVSLVDLLEATRKPDSAELIVYILYRSSLSSLPKEDQNLSAITRLIDWIKKKTKEIFGTPKTKRYSILVLQEVLPKDEMASLLSDWIEFYKERMKEREFVLDPLSAHSIQSMSAIGQILPELMKDSVEVFSEFVLSEYIHDIVGIPREIQKSKKAPRDVELSTFMKCKALKALAKIAIPMSSTVSSSQEFQELDDQILDLIQRQDLMNPNSAHVDGWLTTRSKSGNRSDASRDLIRITATEVVLKLSRHSKTEISNVLFKDIAFMVQDEQASVRQRVVQKLSEHINELLQLGQIHRSQKYAACLTFSALDPREEIKTLSKDLLCSFISIQRRSVSSLLQSRSDFSISTVLPESMLSYLIYIIAHHNDFPEDDLIESLGSGVFDYIQQMLLFGLEPLVTVGITNQGENIPLLKKLLQCIKQSHDAEDPNYDDRIYTICDIALQLLKDICIAGGDQWNKEWEKSFPGTISLPRALYRIDRHLTETSGSHLPKEFRSIPINLFKKTKKRTRERQSFDPRPSAGSALVRTPRASMLTQDTVVKTQTIRRRKKSVEPSAKNSKSRTSKKQKKIQQIDEN